MNVKELIEEVQRCRAYGPLDREIGAVTVNSRAVREGTLFAAIRGETTDGHDYIGSALEAGASAILAEQDVPELFRGTWVQVPDSRRGIAELADAFHGRPSDHMMVAGVTGTNGKTTTAFILQHLVNRARGRCGLIGTVHYDTGLGHKPSSHTTPDWIAVQELLAEMRSHDCKGVAMEVSSHALAQKRVHGIRFDAAIFTNLTQDHLDYHGTMEDYFLAKASFFDHLIEQGGPKKPAAIINIDDSWGRRLARSLDGKLNVVRFGMGNQADFRATGLRISMQGTQFSMTARGREFLVRTPYIGRFNVYNVLGALAAAWSMDLNLREAVAGMAEAPQIPGRMQNVAEAKPFRVYVDYAHTPDALENALRTVRELEPRSIITVVGCGGDRDRTKRPLMGAVAEQHSTWTILTSDNPRSEKPEDILAEIATGMQGERFEVIPDRRAAIARAIELAGARAGGGDVVLIAGKGHEQGQIFADRIEPFDDVKVAHDILRNWVMPERTREAGRRPER